MSKIYHPLLALIASATDNELAKYVEYLKHENKILRVRLPKQVHTRISLLTASRLRWSSFSRIRFLPIFSRST